MTTNDQFHQLIFHETEDDDAWVLPEKRSWQVRWLCWVKTFIGYVMMVDQWRQQYFHDKYTGFVESKQSLNQHTRVLLSARKTYTNITQTWVVYGNSSGMQVQGT